MKKHIIISISSVIGVLISFILCLGFNNFISNFIQMWKITTTMVMGSLVGGGTSEGGGAIAFPVMTKILHIDSKTARIFTFAIQSIGMTAASICNIILRRKVEYKVLIWALPASILGVCISVLKIADIFALSSIRICFTAVLASLGLALFVQRLGYSYPVNQTVLIWGKREKRIVLLAGFIGGICSGIAGVGENVILFIVLVLLFRITDIVATPTTIILLTVTSIIAFILHITVINDFHGNVVRYWQAAAPIVALGGPLGAYISSQLNAHAMRNILLLLIGAEVISTILIVKADLYSWVCGIVLLLANLILCLFFIKIKIYAKTSLKNN